MTFAYKSHPVYSFILLANRDEFYNRPSKTMHYWDDHSDVLAGRDLEHGGTWLGINQQGKFSAVTNYRDGKKTQDNVRSRGGLTREFLCSTSDAITYLQTLQTRQHEYGDYNLLTGDTSGLYYQSNREGPIKKITPGVYGLSNALLDTPWPKLINARSSLQKMLHDNEPERDKLLDIMSDKLKAVPKELPDTGIPYDWELLLSSCFIQSADYGTRATTVLLQKPNGETTIIEKSFGPKGAEEEHEFSLITKAIG
ncbi:MAG: NRDE family protein [Neptuniibacter sp.]